jgi:hypothetical protein
MANIDWPSGFRPVSNGIAGTAPRIRKYTRSTTGAIGEGALLALAQTGPKTDAATNLDGNIIGVSAHFVGASDTEVFIYDDPDQEFIVQGDTAVATPISIIGFYCSLINATTYNATTLQSKTEVDISGATSTTGPADGDVIQIVGLYEAEDNDQDAANAKWVVKIAPNQHKFTSARTMLT